MKNKKIIIISIVILIILILIGIIVLNIYKRKKYGNEIEINGDETTIEINYEYEKVYNYTLFYTVSNCVQKYFDYISLDLNTNTENVDYKTKKDEYGIYSENDRKQAIYNILDKEYITNNNIAIDNVLDYVDKLDQESKFIPLDINMIDGDRIQRYCVYGNINNKDIIIIVNVDYYEHTFSVEPQLGKNANDFSKIKLDTKSYEITTNENNEFDYYRIGKDEIAREYLLNYQYFLNNNVEVAYEKLDQEYREKRFGDLETYKKYVADNKDFLTNGAINQYNVTTKDEYTQYVVTDTNGNYYIFKVTGIMKYSLIGDFYTLGLEEIDSKYDESSTQDKVAINIQKVIAALSSKDYKYVYSKLADEFKSNNYPTLESFETYISGKVYGNRKIEYKDFSNEGNVNICDISLVGSRASDGDPINMQIIMQLKDNRDFVMSFNIKE